MVDAKPREILDFFKRNYLIYSGHNHSNDTDRDGVKFPKIEKKNHCLSNGIR